MQVGQIFSQGHGRVVLQLKLTQRPTAVVVSWRRWRSRCARGRLHSDSLHPRPQAPHATADSPEEGRQPQLHSVVGYRDSHYQTQQEESHVLAGATPVRFLSRRQRCHVEGGRWPRIGQLGRVQYISLSVFEGHLQLVFGLSHFSETDFQWAEPSIAVCNVVEVIPTACWIITRSEINPASRREKIQALKWNILQSVILTDKHVHHTSAGWVEAELARPQHRQARRGKRWGGARQYLFDALIKTCRL